MKKIFLFVLMALFAVRVVSAYPCFDGMLGNGSASNPCQITNWTNLQAMNQNQNINYSLMNDLDSSTAGYGIYQTGVGFSPVGTAGNTFNAVFDGRNHTINGLYINNVSKQYVGLFGATGSGPTLIKNVGLKNVNITGKSYVGGLVGYAYAPTSFSSCFVTGNVTGNLTSGAYIGGIVGLFSGASGQNLNITACHANVTVNGYSHVGGLVGRADSYAKIIKSYSIGKVTASSDYVGGIVGSLASNALVNNSFAAGNVTETGSATSVGGLVGAAVTSNVNNGFYDTNRSGQPNCSGTTPSVCAGVNATGANATYFYNMSNPPMDSFFDVWVELSFDYPKLNWEVVCEDTVCDSPVENCTTCPEDCDCIPPIPEVSGSSSMNYALIGLLGIIIVATFVILRKK